SNNLTQKRASTEVSITASTPPAPLTTYGKAAFLAHKEKIVDYLAANNLGHLLSEEVVDVEKPMLIPVPPLPAYPVQEDAETGKSFQSRVETYQKGFQIHNQAHQLNNNNFEKYQKFIKESDCALALVKNCFRNSENDMVFKRDAKPKSVKEAYENLFKAKELSGNDLTLWLKQLFNASLSKEKSENPSDIYEWIQGLTL
ncbi:hypothetical protein ROZALSC1DRAFT_31237, partial [Rozella allomycis CSF55]